MILQAVATNVITGFLGTGKTSLIKRLLANKPEGETWAVLVNEFGKIGLDASLLDQKTQKSIQIKEVAGGCICCAAGVPLQVAVNQLLMKAKPDRLLIEPTGLGHPQAILTMLSEPHFKQSIKLKSCITLVDARKLSDERYTEHESFNQQLAVSNLVLAAKSDSYSDNELARLTQYLVNKGLPHLTPLPYSDSLPLPETLLDVLNQELIPSRDVRVSQPSLLLNRRKSGIELFDVQSAEVALSIEFDESGIYRQENQGEGFFSYGWVFDINHEFLLRSLVTLVKSIEAIRVKLVMITDEGIVAINVSDGELDAYELDEAMDSRIEIITDKVLDKLYLEQALVTLTR